MPLLCTFVDDDGYRCKTRPLYGYPNLGANFCKIHKKDDMKMVYGKTFCPCGVRPSYGIIGQKPTCCTKCKKPNMVDVRHPKCFCGKKNPSFGFTKQTHCNDCKESGMINLSAVRCKCGVSAIFGYDGSKATCCSKCKVEDMIDVYHKKCICGLRPSFGYTRGKAISCSKCKKSDMVDVLNTQCNCGTRPKYGYPGGLATCCTICKEEGMIHLYAHLCKANEEPYNILCPVLGNKKYAGFCTHCFAHIFPDNPLTALIRKKSKEIEVVNYITTRYDGFRHDKPIYVDFDGGCCASNRRIDLRKLVDGTMLCIEIDEGQHKRYSNIDEISRYNEIFMDFSSKYIFIRYNPDQYKDKNNKTKRPQLNTRMETLEKEINKHINRIKENKNTELLEIHHLFFDEI